VLPRFHNQRQAVLLAREMQSAIAAYPGIITLINLGLGAVVTLMLYIMGMPNPMLWGVMTALLNYVPYLGPALTVVVLTFVALLTYPTCGEALLVALLFLAITSVEGYIITPLAVSTRLTLNPLLILLSLLFWYWMWGIVGALLTVPILVCVKATLERLGEHSTFCSPTRLTYLRVAAGNDGVTLSEEGWDTTGLRWATRLLSARWSTHRPPSGKKKHQCDDQADDEQNPGDVGRGTGDTGKTEQSGDDRNDQKNHCPVKHMTPHSMGG
jgi:hypothetical protein